MNKWQTILDRREAVAEIGELLAAARWSLLDETRTWLAGLQQTAADAISGITEALADVTRRSPGMSTIRNARATAAAVRRLVLSVDEPIFRVLAACDDAADWESQNPLYRENGGGWGWYEFFRSAREFCSTDRGDGEFIITALHLSSEQHRIVCALRESPEYAEWRKKWEPKR